ncbi:hypothetical protein BO83DRAFT_380888 [Aspergillus eucalypticola CBS 122712]|uniref:Uncharacterized protein n=1 Tax=Aspergillus eucalypticola (strain CBS 122712 / IBT 29274) TaxID=1448314 RepID=A0A317V0B6_ASPEC|nr:uncharacterized protein BO83DRAFT_380888 [Aspergillus eucalypticola CBS 122712]PWY66528.1 hypothetical protein BO83DRAFT_380888 [Aspergillus eucalypticola CBS 122712]
MAEPCMAYENLEYTSDHMTPHRDGISSKSILALEAHFSPVRAKFSGAARKPTYHHSINPVPSQQFP